MRLHSGHCISFCLAVFVATLSHPAAGESYVFPLKSQPGSRILTDQNDKPFFWAGDSAWSMIGQATNQEVLDFLDDRKQKGFSVVLTNLIEHKFSVNAPANRAGDPPFSGAPFTTPNEAYFAHADAVISAAASRGIVLLLDPIYLGFNLGDEGWGAEVQAASIANMRSWGQYVGDRYSSFDNIVWLIGGDTNPAPVAAKVQAVVDGILDSDTRHLFTAGNQRHTLSTTAWPSVPWLSLNGVYSDKLDATTLSKAAYQISPNLPFFLLESDYENEHSITASELRAEAYWPVLCGGIGFQFGNCPIWHFGSSAVWCGDVDWRAAMDAAGSQSMRYATKLFLSRPWHLLAPDFSHVALTAGFGTLGTGGYTAAAVTSDGNTLIAYLPTKHPVTVDLTKISGSQAKAWWFNPSNGATTLIGAFSTTTSPSFSPPANGDWVLVIDNAALNLPAPGTAPSVTSAIKEWLAFK